MALVAAPPAGFAAAELAAFAKLADCSTAHFVQCSSSVDSQCRSGPRDRLPRPVRARLPAPMARRAFSADLPPLPGSRPAQTACALLWGAMIQTEPRVPSPHAKVQPAGANHSRRTKSAHRPFSKLLRLWSRSRPVLSSKAKASKPLALSSARRRLPLPPASPELSAGWQVPVTSEPQALRHSAHPAPESGPDPRQLALRFLRAKPAATPSPLPEPPGSGQTEILPGQRVIPLGRALGVRALAALRPRRFPAAGQAG